MSCTHVGEEGPGDFEDAKDVCLELAGEVFVSVRGVVLVQV